MHDARPSRQPSVEQRAEGLRAQMTLEEKVSLMAGAEAFALTAIPRLGIPSLRMTDGPTGVRSNTFEKATVFPVAVALAATFDPEIVRQVAGAIAREAIALGEHVVLAPTINIVRTPLWGRNFETYSEDPCLTTSLGAAYVQGLQEEDVGASLKHFALNNQEHERFTVSAEVDERALREVYLAAFEAIVKRADPWTVMASYNRVNGTYASENARLLTEILKREWNYDGVVVSDWGATHSAAPAADAGLDLEMPGPPRHFGETLLKAVRESEVSEARIDDAAQRILRLMLRTGLIDRVKRNGELMSAHHKSIARRAAQEAIVLLKNDGDLLPLDADAISSLAVIGPNAAKTRRQGDGSSRVHAARRPTVVEGIREFLGNRAAIICVNGVDNEPVPPVARGTMFSPDAARSEKGLHVEYFASPDFSGVPLRNAIERRLAKWVSTRAERGVDFAALRWSGYFWPEKSGRYEFSVRGDGDCRVVVGEEMLISEETPGQDDANDPTGGVAIRRTAATVLEVGRSYPVLIEYTWASARPGAAFETVTIGLREPTTTIADAVAAARAADAAVVVVGSASTTESEGYDRRDIDLPGAQNELVEAVLAANPRTVVVLNAGAAMAMPWIERARAVLCLWLPGEEGPAALASILFGETAPSGRLPVTFPRRLEDNPAHGFYPGGETVEYGEGLFVGYRHYDKHGIAPLFPFGHGLTYTRFEYSDLQAPDEALRDSDIEIAMTLKNAGARSGRETVQIYIRPLDPPVERPLKELKACAKIELDAGESRRVDIRLSPREFAHWDLAQNSWTVAAGGYEILAAASATDIRLRKTIRLV